VIPPSNPSGVEVLLYTRAGCHLCEEAKQQLRELQKKVAFEFREVDIDQDPELCQQYNDEIPVVFLSGKKAFKYRIDAGRFLKLLELGRKREYGKGNREQNQP
jgi:glutaredoxin